jgi:tryptophanyl-tRNA synthetase
MQHLQKTRGEGVLVPTTSEPSKRIISGMRPTGRLHIGHYFGALQNWVRLQNDPAYDCFYFIADWHALTSDYADTSGVAENTLQIMIDYLAAGLDPAKSILFLQSAVPEHAELHLLLSMVTPLGWLERVPTYKEALENVKDKDLHNYGFLGYPILQCADIVIYSSRSGAGKQGAPLYVPVGEDQVSHVEFSREVVRRFNSFYGFSLREQLFEKQHRDVLTWLCTKFGLWGAQEFTSEQKSVLRSELTTRITQAGVKNISEQVPHFESLFDLIEVLTEPEAMLTQTPRIPGLDGRKMSKSYGNAITLSQSDADIRAKTKVMVTDPARKRRTDPGNPDVCPVYDWHKLFSAEEPGRLEWVRQGCTTAGIGCIECKAAMAENLIKWIAPVRERRVKYEKNPKQVLELLDAGSKKARVVAQGTMERVREAVFGWKKKRDEISGAAAKA